MQSFTQFNTKSYHNPTDTKNQEIIIHKNQTDIFHFLQPIQLTIFDFLGVKNA